jgi:hypothetical protein
MPRRALLAISFAALLLAGAALWARERDAGDARADPGVVTVSVDRGVVVGRSGLALGVTHTEYSLDPWGDPSAVSRGATLLQRVARMQNQHIYGWGALNPEPRRGRFAWDSLDRRVALMRSQATTPVITLCCAPDWMTALGEPTSTYPNLPPQPEHVDDFARLAAAVARRYPDVRHYMVWNELKGFYDADRRRWDIEAYTRLYNAVYAALKEVDPAISVGGPYFVVEGTGSSRMGGLGSEAADPLTPADRELLRYWLDNATGADFVAVDRSVHPTHDDNRYSRADYLDLTRWHERIALQVREMTSLPLWFAEDYFRNDPDWRFQAAGLASMLAAELRGGASASLRWGPQGTSDRRTRGNRQSLFSSTLEPGGGRPYPAYHVYAAFARHFRPGTRIVRSSSSSPSRLEVLASPRATLLINRRPATLRVRLDGVQLRLRPWETRAVARRR